MVVPVVIAAVAVASAVAQNYQAAKARKASEAELKKIRAMWDSVVPPDFDASIDDPPEYIRSLPPPPSFNMKKLTPEVYKVVARYEPQGAELIREAAPQLVKDSAEGSEGRQAQVDALRRFKQISQDGQDPEMAALLDEAAQRAQIESQSRQASILQDAARRGTMGSGLALAAQLSGAEQAMSDQAAASRQAAIEAYRNKLGAMRESAALGGQISAADRQLSSQNADIINAFNARTSAAAQSQANLQAQLANQGQLFNVQSEQGAADKNTAMANQLMQSERDRADDLAKYGYGAQMDQIKYQNQMAESLANWAKQEKERQNALKQQSFGNKMNIVGGKTGVGQMMAQNAIGAGQDKNASIQAATNAVIGGLSTYQSSKDREAAEQRADARAQKYGWNG